MNPPSQSTRVHGLDLAAVTPGGTPDTTPAGMPRLNFEVLPARACSPEDPEGRVIARLAPPSGYSAALSGERLAIRFFETAEFEIDLVNGSITVAPAPGREAMAEILLLGNVLSIILGLRGEAVLHASTVLIDGHALAIAGPSGAGKSTVAALLCGEGAELVGEDTARLELSGEAPSVYRGVQELRLRPAAAALAGRLAAAPQQSGDARTTVPLPSTMPTLVRLSAIVLPEWADRAGLPTVERLGAAAALRSLIACPRVGGWVAPEPLRANLDAFTALARGIACFALSLPRGKLGDQRFGAEIRTALLDAGAIESPWAE